MGSTVFPAPSAASKTAYRTTLISGTSWTVPAGVTYVNVTLYGGAGGNAGSWSAPGMGGISGSAVSSMVTTTPGASIAYAIGAGGAGGTAGGGSGNAGGTTTFTGATSAAGGARGDQQQFGGGAGPNYRGAGNAPATNNPVATASYAGPAGGSGCIDIEYWAQEIMMRVFAVVEDNKVTNVIVGVEDEVVAANPGKYIEYTNGWDYNNGIDGGVYFPAPTAE